MLWELFIFSSGAVAASYVIWLATVYEDEYVTNSIRKMKRQLHLLQSEPRVDMDWFDETLDWSSEQKRRALENQSSSNETGNKKTVEEVRVCQNPTPYRSIHDPKVSANTLEQSFEQSADEEMTNAATLEQHTIPHNTVFEIKKTDKTDGPSYIIPGATSSVENVRVE